jgi:TolB-like protein/class 3 adenylate cyclase/Tfp pilus assembly protein PilF
MSDLTDVTRKLVAVFAADVEGYSRLMGTDEVGTLKGLTERRAILDRIIGEHRGRIANTAGDSVLAEFGSAVDAVKCAVDAQTALAEANSSLPPERRINFRMGVHIGDVMVRAGDLFGDGVNIAARLQTLARAGGLCISGVTYDQVRKILPLSFADLGAQTVKNVEEPIRAYEISGLGKDIFLGSREVPAPRLSIVVLPFANLGGDPDQDYFADGVTESLTTDLSRIAGAFVIARNTAFTFKGKAVDIKKVGRELHVRYVLEGSVQRAGNRLRINVQLIDAEGGHHLWADRFDKTISDIFEMQDEIVTQVASALDAQFVTAEARRAERAPHPDAMDMYFQGLAWIYRGIAPEDFAHAQNFFKRGLAIDPTNADLLVGAAMVDLSKASYYLTDDRQARFAVAEATLNEALSAAPDHARARALLGVTLCATHRASLGLAECERALSLNPNLAQAHAYIGYAKYLLGLGSQTEAHVSAALRLSPRDTFAYLWLLFAGTGKFQVEAYAEAVEWFNRSIEAHRNFPMAHFQLASALAHLGKLSEARTVMKQGLALHPGFTIRRFRSYISSDHPIFLATHARMAQGLLLAGLPEA